MSPASEAFLGKSVGNYTLVRSLGVGGMGAVYLGENLEIHSRVAIKVLLPRFVENASITRRFLDEARAVNRIGHTGIVRIHDCGRQDDVGVYLVMELLEGRTLEEILHTEGTFSEERVVRLLRQTAAALSASHHVGIIHRDLKPSNIFLVPDSEVPGGERVKILDFGIAKLLENTDPAHRESTQTGMVMGSLPFMSPEQCVDTKRVDERTDVYSLGAIGYHLLSGAVPFEAETLGQLVLKQQHSEPQPLRSLMPEVSEQLAAIIHHALVVDPDSRLGSMTAVRDALDRLSDRPASGSSLPVLNIKTVSDPQPGATTLSGTTGEVIKLKQAAAARRRVVIGGVLALLLAGGFVVWRTSSTGPGVDPDVEPGVAAGPVADVPDAGAPLKPDLVGPDLHAPDMARATGQKPGPRRLPVKTSPVREVRPVDKARPADKAQPQKPQDGVDDDEDKPYFNEL